MFILDKPFTDTDTFIYLLVPCDDGRLKLSTKLKIHPKAWSVQTERPIVGKDGKGRATFTLLNRIAETVDRLRDDCRLNYVPFAKDKVHAVVLPIISGRQKQAPATFAQGLLLVQGKMRDGTLLTNKQKRYDAGTIKRYGYIGADLQNFVKDTGLSLEFSRTTMDTYQAVKSWCYSKNLAINTTGNYLKIWKGILRNAYTLGLHRNEIFNHKDFKIIREQTEDIYLTLTEIKAIEDVDLLQEDAHWQGARDWFLIACYSALRASDLKRITPDHIGKTILIATEKTDEQTEIPIHPVVAKILKKHKGPPPYMHQNDINQFIKFVARKAGLDEPVLYVITKGGKRKEEYLKKWQMVSLHTARRSFITNARLLGMPDSIIMKIAAIRNPRTLQTYDKLTTKEAARLAGKHPFFAK